MKQFGPKKLLMMGYCGMLACCLSFLLIATLNLQNVVCFFITTLFAYLFGSFLFSAGSYFALETTIDKANGASMMSFINMFSAVLSVVIIGYLLLPIILSFAIVVSGFFSSAISKFYRHPST